MAEIGEFEMGKVTQEVRGKDALVGREEAKLPGMVQKFFESEMAKIAEQPVHMCQVVDLEELESEVAARVCPLPKDHFLNQLKEPVTSLVFK